jgi:hypothetical protein
MAHEGKMQLLAVLILSPTLLFLYLVISHFKVHIVPTDQSILVNMNPGGYYSAFKGGKGQCETG